METKRSRGSYVPFDQVVGDDKGGVSESIVMVQSPVVCDFWADALNPVFQSFEDFQIKFGVYSCTRFYKLMINQSANVKKRDEQDFHL